jgi:hypothetical protein
MCCRNQPADTVPIAHCHSNPLGFSIAREPQYESYPSPSSQRLAATTASRPPAVTDGISLLFCCPSPDSRHHRKTLYSLTMLAALYSCLWLMVRRNLTVVCCSSDSSHCLTASTRYKTVRPTQTRGGPSRKASQRSMVLGLRPSCAANSSRRRKPARTMEPSRAGAGLVGFGTSKTDVQGS